mgnify:CR=1 FL=1
MGDFWNDVKRWSTCSTADAFIVERRRAPSGSVASETRESIVVAEVGRGTD